MPTTLFLQSDINDPYEIYETMLKENPVFRDKENDLWAIYSYKNCKEVLANPVARVPAAGMHNKTGLNEYALLIAGQLARLSNGPQHEEARQIVLLLLENRKTIAVTDVFTGIMEKEKHGKEIDWVNTVCKKLPVMLLLKGFDFKESEGEFIADKIEDLVKIMLPDKTGEQVSAINMISKEIYCITEKHILTMPVYKEIIAGRFEKTERGFDVILSLCVSNLIGLFIQSYDGGRGILSNSLLQILGNPHPPSKAFTGRDYFEKSVIETLRFDPPVHNTRRIAADDILLGNTEIKKGQTLFIVLAAANRDPSKFDEPGVYDINRTNNNEHLTFGVGAHKCPGKNFSVNMTTEILSCLFEKYKAITLLEKNRQYEPMINVRLPKNIFIALS